MEIAILGLPQSGKTTTFLALGGESARVAAERAHHSDPVVATIAIPDNRVDRLAEMAGSGRAVHASLATTDLPGLPPEHIERQHGLPDKHLQYLGSVDALLAVIRAFDNGTGIPIRVEADRETIETELIVTDLQRIEKRHEKLQRTIHRVSGHEREEGEIELSAVGKIHVALDEGRPVRTVELTDREEVATRGMALLSQKPIAWVLNVSGEEGGPTIPPIPEDLGSQEVFAWLDAETEKEIAELDEESRADFMESYGIDEPATVRIAATCFQLLDRITFFSANEKEAHAWTVGSGATAVEAAGAIHSDFASGFIRAEVVAWSELEAAGSVSAARKANKIRAEGKNYIVQEGDVIQFLFHK